jgi:hypothetical protein
MMRRALKDDRVFVFAVFGAFMFLEIASILHHEPWRDEMAVWMVAKYNSLQGIVREAGLQAQPALWYLVVKAVQQVIPSPDGMKAANLAFIALAVILLLRYAPFSRLEKVFLCFGYFILYEYGTIARNYAMSVLVLFAVCALYPLRRKHCVLISILLAVFCNIQTMNILLALAFVFLLAAEKVFHQWSSKESVVSNRQLLFAVSIVVLGTLLSLWQAAPPDESPWSLSAGQKWVFYSPLGALKTMWLGFAPVAIPTVHFWNTNILPDGRMMIALSLFILVSSGLFLVRKPLVAAFYISGIVLLLGFFYRVYHGFTRHHGYLLVMFIISVWIAENYQEQRWTGWRVDRSIEFLRQRWSFFTLVCFVGFCAVFAPLYYDWQHPFSASRDVARYLADSGSQECVLLGDVDVCVASVAGWLDRPMYYPAIGAFSKAVVWDARRRRRAEPEKISSNPGYQHGVWRTAVRLAEEQKKDVILVLNYRIDKELLHESRVSIVADESYYLYRARFDRPSSGGRMPGEPLEARALARSGNSLGR